MKSIIIILILFAIATLTYHAYGHAKDQINYWGCLYVLDQMQTEYADYFDKLIFNRQTEDQ